MGVFVKWQGWRTNTVHYIEKSTFGSNTFSHHFTHCHVRIFDRKSKRWQGGSYHSCLAGMAVSCPTETRYSSYVRIESMGQVWPNPMSWALREICRGARKSPPILAEHCNAGHQTSMERRQTSFACLGWWKNFHMCVCVWNCLVICRKTGGVFFVLWDAKHCFNMLKHIETYWHMLKHVEMLKQFWLTVGTPWISLFLALMPPKHNVSSTTQRFGTLGCAIYKVSMIDVYPETRPFSQCALKEPPQEQHQTPRTSRNIMKPWIQHVVQIYTYIYI
jgi:hypothetical protein